MKQNTYSLHKNIQSGTDSGASDCSSNQHVALPRTLQVLKIQTHSDDVHLTEGEEDYCSEKVDVDKVTSTKNLVPGGPGGPGSPGGPAGPLLPGGPVGPASPEDPVVPTDPHSPCGDKGKMTCPN